MLLVRAAIAAFIAAHILSGPQAIASTFELSSALTPYLSKKTYSTDDRRRLARALVEYWKSFDTRIPRLPPDENRWIKGELDSSVPARVLAIMSRRETSQYQALRLISECAEQHETLLSHLGGNPKREALSWARLMSCYNGSLQEHLRAAGFMKEDKADDPFFLFVPSVVAADIPGPILGSVLGEPDFK